jgi:DNA-binding transcriptional MocR family regulator
VDLKATANRTSGDLSQGTTLTSLQLLSNELDVSISVFSQNLKTLESPSLLVGFACLPRRRKNETAKELDGQDCLGPHSFPTGAQDVTERSHSIGVLF